MYFFFLPIQELEKRYLEACKVSHKYFLFKNDREHKKMTLLESNIAK